jgi:hypothetical protein
MKTVILLSGKLQSGKNQFSEYLSSIYSDNNISCGSDLFAKAVKDGTKEDFKDVFAYLNELSVELLHLSSDVSELHPNISNKITNISEQLKTVEDNFYEDKTKLTRLFLQIYGTEVFRKRVDTDWWVKQLIKRVKESNDDVIFVTDVRFPNEINLLLEEKEFNVCSIRINRNINRNDNFNTHYSETALDDYKDWSFVVDNNFDLEYLYNKAKEIYKKLHE